MDDAKRVVALWTGILAPPIAWALDVQINYALLQYICLNRAAWILWAVTALMLALTVFGAVQARRGLAAGDSKRDRFMGLAGLFIAASFFLAIVCTAIAFVYFRPCD
jgi:hypothetical protein